jgi:dTDP-4-amino-4,6-dideoxygalactose transaminase
LRYTLFLEQAAAIRLAAKKRAYVLGDWYTSVIMPQPVNPAIGYIPGSCPQAEGYAKVSINLPTHHKVSTQDAEAIVNIVQANCK